MADERTSAGTPGLLNATLRIPTLMWQAGTLGSPLLGAAYTAAALGVLGYAGGPWLTKKFARVASPVLSESDRKELEVDDAMKSRDDIKKERRTWAGVLAALGALGVVGLNWRPNWPDKGMFSYASVYGAKDNTRYDNPPQPAPATKPTGIPKVNSMPDLGGALPLGQCIDMIRHNSELEPYMKGQALTLLESFNEPLTQPVNGGNLIGQAIATGQSAATGLAVGWLTANVLGLPNPKSTAILGAVANTLGTGPALAASLALGH